MLDGSGEHIKGRRVKVGSTYLLDGTKTDNLHGWFDNALAPLLRVSSGDTVVYRTADSGWDDWPPGTTDIESSVRRPQGAGHALTGPILVEGAEPGDTLAVHIREMIPRDWAFAAHRPGNAFVSGVLAGEPDDVAEDYLRHLFLNRDKGIWQFNERIEIPLSPFMGIFGVAPEIEGRTSTVQPGPHGGNMDCKEFGAGTTVFLPVFVDGALFSLGDGHGAQGDGEVDGAAIETGMDRVVVEFTLHKDMKLNRPCAETLTHLLFLAFHEDLDTAVLEAARDVMYYLIVREGLTQHEAYNLASLAIDFRISQVVDGLKGVHAMLPKSIFTSGITEFAQ
jgi:acetamidase/formamidase